MKSLKLITFLSLLLASHLAQADLSSDLDSLGGNKEIIRKAKILDPDNKIRVVQNRTVDRNLRLEIGGSFGMVTGGDPYVSTDNLGVNLDFHINPRWSIGARYYTANNELTSEGKRVLDASINNPNAAIFDTDYPEETYLGVINWYPIYGKLNLLDLGVAQFDIYALGGYGQVRLSSGTTGTWTAGGGIGLWLSQHFSTRLEARYQAYEDQVYSGKRALDLTVLSLSLGILL